MRRRARRATACGLCRPSSGCRAARPGSACAGACSPASCPARCGSKAWRRSERRSSFSSRTARAARCCSRAIAASLQDAAPEEILNALVGIRLGPDDLRAMLGGCVRAAAEPTGARAYGADWLAVDLAAGGTVYLRRIGNAWRIVAGRYGGLEIDYPAFQGDRPSQVVLRGTDLEPRARLEPGRGERRSAARPARRVEDSRRRRAAVARGAAQAGRSAPLGSSSPQSLGRPTRWHLSRSARSPRSISRCASPARAPTGSTRCRRSFRPSICSIA